MTMTSSLRVLFRVAAGPRLGFGHLVRCRSLARALGVPARVSIRGTAVTRRTAARLGWEVLSSRLEALATAVPDVLVVDDPRQSAAALWVRAARRRGVPVVSIHDLGLAPVPAQLSVDGSVGRTVGCGTDRALRGPRFAVLDPAIAARRRTGGARSAAPSVLVALGGGQHARRAVAPLVARLARRRPDLDVRVAAGFAAGRRPQLPAGRVVDAPHGLAPELAKADVAVVAGGVTLYEACALGVPAVAAAVAPAQRPAIAAMARAGAVWPGGSLRGAADARRLARLVAALLDDPDARRTLARRARRVVDGRGVWRVAAEIRRLADVA